MTAVSHASPILGRIVGAPARWCLIGAVRMYRVTLSGWLGGQCRFYPSCSHYAEDAIRTHGAVKGTALSVWRVLRCNPYGAGGVDPVPVREGRGGDLRMTTSYTGSSEGTEKVNA